MYTDNAPLKSLKDIHNGPAVSKIFWYRRHAHRQIKRTPVNSIYDYHREIVVLEGLAPRVEWHVTGSPHARGREGELIVYAGAILHIDCIFDR